MGIKNAAIDFDMNTHGAGSLLSSQVKVFILNLPVCLFGDVAEPDFDCDDDHPPIHCTPNSIQGSFKVFIDSRGIHRHGDLRACGATTVSVNTKVFVG